MRTAAIFAALLGALLVAAPGPGAAQQGEKKRSVGSPKKAAGSKYLVRRAKLNQSTVTVVSGNPNDTYLLLAYDMSAVLDSGDELRVLPVVGKGAYQNMMDLLHLKSVDLGITQADILSYLKKTGEFGPNIERRVAYIATLYTEELHVLAGPSINSLQDLNGKKVNFSDDGSGTQFSVRRIFEALGIKAHEVNMGQIDGYHKVKSGEIAATILIGGKPTAAYATFTLEPGMKMLPVPYVEALEGDYLPAKLTSDDYPNLIPKGATIETVAVASVLAVYNWPRDTDRYRRVATFVDAFFSKFAQFRQGARHGRWREANLSATLRGWKRFPAAEEWLKKHPPDAVSTASVKTDPGSAKVQPLKTAPDEEQERLFEEYLKWSKRQKKR